MSVYDTARTCHEEREMGRCTPRWTGERTGQLSGAGMTFAIRLCIGQVLGVSPGNIRSATVKDLAYDFKYAPRLIPAL